MQAVCSSRRVCVRTQCFQSAPQLPVRSFRTTFSASRLNSRLGGSQLVLPLLVPQGPLLLRPLTCPPSRKVVTQSFLGVGAPEALLVAVVALVVFGPKGLAEAAKSVGGALKTFQPTIKEVVEVSQELKGTLEKELGLDELREAARPVAKRTITPELGDAGAGLTPVTDTLAKAIDPEIEAKRAASAEMAWGPAKEAAAATAAATAPAAAAAAGTATAAAGAAAAAAPAKPEVSSMSIEELEAELARRKAVQQN